MASSTTVFVTDVSLSFPILPSPCIDREHNLKTIDHMFHSGGRIVVVTGQADIGKTTLLAQFAASKGNAAISFFIRPISDLGYDPVQFQYDLCNQLTFILDGVRLNETVVPTQADARELIHRFVRQARQTKKTLYFIVDGLADVPTVHADVTQWILEVLPLEMESFRILLSGDVDRLPERIRSADCLKTFVLGGFSHDEQRRALEGCGLTDSDVGRLSKFCNGSPGVTQSVRRLLLQGQKTDDILDLATDEAIDLFRLEWNKVQQDDKDQLLVLTL
ncbi:MAG TPA: ATP-binding protein, partial [Methylococcaceae bacterium]|nr:ATP-binding protein [Methylococcaceae bacterium]